MDKLRILAGNKKGSYILEAAITLPVFLIAVIVMSSVILMYACIEDCTFITANELRKCASEAIITDTSPLAAYRRLPSQKIVQGDSSVNCTGTFSLKPVFFSFFFFFSFVKGMNLF